MAGFACTTCAQSTVIQSCVLGTVTTYVVVAWVQRNAAHKQAGKSLGTGAAPFKGYNIVPYPRKSGHSAFVCGSSTCSTRFHAVLGTILLEILLHTFSPISVPACGLGHGGPPSQLMRNRFPLKCCRTLTLAFRAGF